MNDQVDKMNNQSIIKPLIKKSKNYKEAFSKVKTRF